MIATLRRLWEDGRAMQKMPRLTINLMHYLTAQNDPFYARLVSDFHRFAGARRRFFPFVRQFEFGVALCVLPASFDDYFMKIEAAARRNYKKAQRNGFEFRRICYNDYLEDIAAIRRSATVRQGRLSREFLEQPVLPCQDPPSRSAMHEYPYFGVVKDGKLVAYAGCLLAGEVLLIESIYGHAQFHAEGVVPMLLIGIARELYDRHPQVKYYGYGTFYGAGPTLRRFKKKFLFLPHRIRWVLGEEGPAAREQWIYRRGLSGHMPVDTKPGMTFRAFVRPWQALPVFPTLRRELGSAGCLKVCVKLMSRRRLFFLVCDGSAAAHYAWATLGKCRHYPIETDAAVIGPVETMRGYRGRGLATWALAQIMNALYDRRIASAYIDTSDTNYPMQHVIQKCGFGEPVRRYMRPEDGL